MDQEILHHDDRICIEAPAKINLFLRVIRRRPDGYHDLETLMQKIALYDLLTLHKANSSISLQCPDSDLPENQENLVYKAAQAFFETAGIDGGVTIVLEKKIPVAAGLGGGSSDAAAALNGLNSLYETNLSVEKLRKIGRSLGADVPFFIDKVSAAWATGIGDRLQKTENYWKGWIVLVNPGFPVSTKWVYQNFALTTNSNPYILGREKKYAENDVVLDQFQAEKLYNDLEAVTEKKYPAIKQIKEKMLEFGAAGTLMSGSGPSVFGLFASKKTAISCMAEMKKLYGNKVFLTRSVD